MKPLDWLEDAASLVALALFLACIFVWSAVLVP